LIRAELVDESLRLARLLRELMPDEREVRGLLALLVVTDARRATRVDARGQLVLLQDQDRSRWDRAAIAEAHQLIMASLRAGHGGRFTLQAAIGSLHAEATTYDETDWPQIVRLYDELLAIWPSPIVALNRAVAIEKVDGPTAALAIVTELELDGRLENYQYLPAIKAHLLNQLGRTEEADVANQRAAAIAENEIERDLLVARTSAVRPRSSDGSVN
jgi:predicted RNA polymerase sigma factor